MTNEMKALGEVTLKYVASACQLANTQKVALVSKPTKQQHTPLGMYCVPWPISIKAFRSVANWQKAIWKLANQQNRSEVKSTHAG